jgi:hypothetical protein
MQSTASKRDERSARSVPKDDPRTAGCAMDLVLRVRAKALRHSLQCRIMWAMREHNASVFFPLGRSGPFAVRTSEPHHVCVTARHVGPPAVLIAQPSELPSSAHAAREAAKRPYCHLSKRRQAGAAEVGSCLTDATRGGRSGEPFVSLPLCCDPNGLRNNHRGLLTRWNHLNLRARRVAGKVWTNQRYCQAVAPSSRFRVRNGTMTAPLPLC